jgi:hypothetical protein
VTITGGKSQTAEERTKVVSFINDYGKVNAIQS